jgi:hypothetical protein
MNTKEKLVKIRPVIHGEQMRLYVGEHRVADFTAMEYAKPEPDEPEYTRIIIAGALLPKFSDDTSDEQRLQWLSTPWRNYILGGTRGRS